jgi:NAD(P)-dependent dehydrogenase (short-subunit alcohol dehydrogenase family)
MSSIAGTTERSPVAKARHAVVTGGGSGIGAAIARELATEGHRVSLIGRRPEPIAKVARAIGGFAVVGDVTERQAVEAAFDAARAAHGPIEILLNCAGDAPSAKFASVTIEQWRATLAVNLDALFHCIQAALPDLLAATCGRIVTIASTAGLKGYGYVAPYVAAKHGAIGLTRALAAEYARTSLTINAVCPGFTDTDLVTRAVANIRSATGRDEQAARAELAGHNPQRRLIAPEEVAAAVIWLCRPDSQSITGQAIAVAGGEVT